jgi:D-sedoheptulose 7-phosphate isomerase
MKNYFLDNIEEHLKVINLLKSINKQMELAIKICSDSIQSGGKILVCGNGGSAADSQHLAAEFIGRYIKDRVPIPCIALTTDSSILTCISNDYSFENVFSRQVEALSNRNDCLIAISTSGNSQNIYNAILAASKKGSKTIGLLGNDGGKIKNITDLNIIVNSNTTARIQEAHLLIEHVLCGAVEKNLNLV